jgi:dTDP-4-amino-4,6-dideoxygalactose transaminase
MEDSVKEFESKFAKFCGKKYCIAVRSGTDALNMAKAIKNPYFMQSYRYRLLLPGIQEIITKDGAIDLEDLKSYPRLLKNSCLLLTYMNSVQPDLEELLRIKKKYNLFIIEDACQAVGRKLIGDISCFSLYPAKMIGGMGKGGALITNSKVIYNKLKKIRDDKWNNLWLDEIKAAYLNVRIKYLPELLKMRQQVVDYYNKNLSQKVKILSKNCLQNYIIIDENSKHLIKYLHYKGIEAFSDESDFYEGNIKGGVRLPCYAELTKKEAKYVVKSMNQYYGK